MKPLVLRAIENVLELCYSTSRSTYFNGFNDQVYLLSLDEELCLKCGSEQS